MKLSLKLVQYGSPEFQAALALREGVRPLGIAVKHEDCSNEENCIHFGVFDGNELIATALLAPQINCGKMQRVGVIRERQNQGIGSKLLDFVEKEAMHKGMATIYCHAHEQAVPFYAKHGYEPEGPYFFEHGIKHVKMRKFLLGHVQLGTEEEMKVVDRKLCEFINRQIPFTQALEGNHEPVMVKNYVIKDDGEIIAGIKSDVYGWKILYIELLFVEESHRHKGLGSFLLNKVETEAMAMGSKLAHLDTFDLQAKEFYMKHGYEIFGVLEDCPPGHKRFYLKKAF